MTAHAALQSLLRFLAQDAKLSLVEAMKIAKDLHKADLNSPEAISKTQIKDLQTILPDEKLSKQVHNAARRVSRKRGSDAAPSASSKRTKVNEEERRSDKSTLEASLSLPELETDVEVISKTNLQTNRAPVVLAFAVMLLQYTMPEQPLSSRLSLAQAVVSLNSRSKAVSLGLENSKSAEEEGWGEGQPVVKVMGRDVRVLKRWEATSTEPAQEEPDRQGDKDNAPLENCVPALWGLDLEALRSFNRPTAARAGSKPKDDLPIYTPQSAREYLLKSFASAPKPDQSSPGRKSGAAVATEKRRNLGLLLGALDLLYSSWFHVLSKDELDRRAWQWYVRTRPEVDSGVAGWGAKGELRLQELLDLRRIEPAEE